MAETVWGDLLSSIHVYSNQCIEDDNQANKCVNGKGQWSWRQSFVVEVEIMLDY